MRLNRGCFWIQLRELIIFGSICCCFFYYQKKLSEEASILQLVLRMQLGMVEFVGRQHWIEKNTSWERQSNMGSLCSRSCKGEEKKC
jgi:hypothetical protein